MKRFSSYLLVVISTLAFLLLLVHFRIVVALFLLSLFTAAAVRPVIRRLTDRGIALPVAMLATYAVGLGLVIAFLVAVGQSTIAEVQDVLNDLARAYETRYPTWKESGMVLQAIASRLPPPDALYELLAADEGTLLAQGLLGVGQSILTMLGGFVVVLALSIYWSTDRLRFERLWLTLVTASKRAEARRIWRNVEEGVGGYLRSAVVQSYAAALLLGLGYLLIGLPFPTLLAIVAALAWLIPLLGFLAAVVLAFLAGLSEGILVALFVALYTAGLFLLLRRLAGPRLAEWRDLHSSLLAVVMMIVLAEAYGLAGLLLAWPLAVAVETLVIELMRQRRSRLEAGSPPGRIAELENRLRQIQAQLASDADSPSPELASLAERTAALVEEAKVSLELESRDAATPS